MTDFLIKHREAVIMYSRLAYDEEAHMAAIREDSYSDGYGTGYDSGQMDKTIDAAKKLMRNLKLTGLEALEFLELRL